jgi:flagella basal body P-ring formation protein FlgA
MTGRPLPRSKVRLAVALMILAWATQLLLHQWGYGAEARTQGAERFVGPAAGGGATLELRDEATVYGSEVRLKQVFRWAERDAAAAGAIGELVLARLDADAPYKSISLNEIKATLRDAGVSLAAVRFTGATTCTVARADAEVDQTTALEQWANAKRGGDPGNGSNGTARVSATPVAPPTRAEASADATSADASPVRTLRDLLKADICQRLRVAPDALQITFNPKDEGTLNLAEPQFHFNLTPRRVRDLGPVAWDVAVVGRDNAVRTVAVSADARAWRHEVVAAKPLAFKQVIQSGDLEERRVLADRLPPAPLLARSQLVGQQAARDLKPGTVLTARLVDPVPLAKSGQLITVNVAQGAVRIKTVARALEGGSFGETIRVKNDQTRDVFTVVLTGPQEGSVGPPPAEATTTGAKARTPIASAQP